MRHYTYFGSVCFNPRTRKGCDSIPHLTIAVGSVSIHAPVKDATSFSKIILSRSCFNPRTRKGCDYMFMESFIDNIFSI